MRDHSVFVVKFTQRVPFGVWEAQDEKVIHGYGEPKEFQSYYVAPSKEIVEAHWRHWNRFSADKEEVTLVSVDRVDRATVILELR